MSEFRIYNATESHPGRWRRRGLALALLVGVCLTGPLPNPGSELDMAPIDRADASERARPLAYGGDTTPWCQTPRTGALHFDCRLSESTTR